ncbi:MAG: EthD family reductase [Anaerolineae bacterium]
MEQLYKLVTIYRKVDDEQKLETFFASVHLQLAEQLPGLLKTELTRIYGKPGGESRFHLMYTLYFANKNDYEAAMLSEVGQQLFQALIPWAEARLLTWFNGEAFADKVSTL